MGECSAWGRNAWGVKKEEEEVEEPIVSLVEIMNEEMVHSIEDEDKRIEEEFLRKWQEEEDRLAGIVTVPETTHEVMDDDLALAQALQREFDREYDLSTRMEQQKSCGKNTVTVTPDRYCPKNQQEADDDMVLSEDERENETVLLYAQADEMRGMPTGQVTTKHNALVAARKNVDKVMNGIGVRDLAVGDMTGEQMNSKVFNKLRQFSKLEVKRQNKLKDKEEKATMETSVDVVTRLSLFKWINQGLFDRIEEIIATGKESAVLHGVLDEPSSHFAVKVYKTTLTEFKNRAEYVKDDFRFKNPRNVLKVWAEKEFLNLNRMHRSGLPCPQPIKLKKHLLVMSLIGMDGFPAPKLKNVEWALFTEEERKEVYDQVEQIMLRMYQECSLVHGDLSEFNLLLSDGVVSVIDVSQAMDLSHPRVLYYLLRDIDNILSFFACMATPGLPSNVDLFNRITDLEMNGESDLTVQVEKFEAENRNVFLRMNRSKPADWELSLYEKERKHAVNRDESPAREYR